MPGPDDEVAGGSGTIVLRADSDRLPQGFDNFDALPRCKESRTHNESIRGNLGIEVDLLAVNPDDRSQVESSFTTGALPVPYVKTSFFNPYAEDDSVFQELIRAWNVRCLPTRLLIQSEGDISLIEFREGSSAFQAKAR